MNPTIDPHVPWAPAGDTGLGSGSTDSPGTIAQAKQKITQSARDATTKLKSAASDAATRAKEQAQHVVTEKRDAAASRIGSYSSAIHESARSLEEQDPNIAWLTHKAAERLESVATYVRTRDFHGLREDAEGIARRHPAAFFGGLFVAGLVIGNLLKARQDGPDLNSDNRQTDWTGDETAGLGGQEFPASTPSAGI